MEEGIVILARCKFHSIREHENLVWDPRNNMSISYTLHLQIYLKLHVLRNKVETIVLLFVILV